jgi:hypothetical protein
VAMNTAGHHDQQHERNEQPSQSAAPVHLSAPVRRGLIIPFLTAEV